MRIRAKMDPIHTDNPKWLKHTELSRAWFENPDKNKIRAAAKRVIKKRINDIVEPAGFSPSEHGTGWELKKRFVTRGIYVQPSKGGVCCYFNIARKYRYQFMGPGKVLRLQHFYKAEYDRVGDPGSLNYYDIEQFPKYVDEVMEVIETQVVPWLLK